MALNVGELYATFNMDASGATTAINGLMAKVSSLQGAYIALGGIMTRVFTKNILSGAKDVINTTMSFDAAMAKVAAVSGIDTTSEAYSKLRETALQYASTSKYTANEVASAMYYMGLAGWSAEEMIAGLPGMLAMGAASGEDLSRTSDILTDALTAMGYSAEDATMFANIFAAASANSNTTITQMGEAMKYVGAVGGALTFKMEDVAIALGIMANNGIKGSQAGTALRRILTNLAAPTAKVSSAMEALGLSLDDGEGNAIGLYDYILQLRTAFKDFSSTPTFKALSDALSVDPEDTKATASHLQKITKYANELGVDYNTEEFQKLATDYEKIQYIADTIFSKETESGGLSQLLTASLAKDLAGQYGLTALLALINTTDEDLQQLYESVYGSNEGEGTAFEMMQTQLDNLQGSLTLFNSALESLKINMGDMFTDSIKNVVDSLTEMVNKLNEMPDSTKQTISEMLLFAAAIGPVLASMGKLSALSSMMSTMMTSMFSPMGMLISTTALFGLAAMDDDNSVGEMLDQMSQTISDKLDALTDYLSEHGSEVSERMSGLIESLTSVVQALIPSVSGILLTLFTTIVDSLAENAEGMVDLAVSIVTTLADSITTNLDTIIPSVIQAIIDVITALADHLPEFATSIGSLVSGLMTSLTDAILDVDNWTSLFNMGKAIVTGIATGIWTAGSTIFTSVFENLKRLLTGLFGMTDEEYEELYGDYAPMYKEDVIAADLVVGAINRGTPKNVEELEQLTDAYDYVLENFPELSEKFKDYGYLFNESSRELIDQVVNGDQIDRSTALWALKGLGFEELFESLYNPDTDLDYSDWTLNKLLDWFDIDPEKTKQIDEAAKTVEEAGEAAEGISEEEKAIYESLETITEELGLSNTEGGKGMVEGIKEGTNAVIEAANTLGSETVNAAMQSLTLSEGNAIGSQFVSGLVGALTAGISQMAAVAAAISSAFNSNLNLQVPDVSFPSASGSTTTTGTTGSTSNKTNPVYLVQDGKITAKVSSKYNITATNNHVKTVAKGYGG